MNIQHEPRTSTKNLSQLVAMLRRGTLSALIHGCAGETKTAIFTGLSFWMTGRTCLPDQELKRLIVEHGGVVAADGYVGLGSR